MAREGGREKYEKEMIHKQAAWLAIRRVHDGLVACLTGHEGRRESERDTDRKRKSSIKHLVVSMCMFICWENSFFESVLVLCTPGEKSQVVSRTSSVCSFAYAWYEFKHLVSFKLLCSRYLSLTLSPCLSLCPVIVAYPAAQTSRAI